MTFICGGCQRDVLRTNVTRFTDIDLLHLCELRLSQSMRLFFSSSSQSASAADDNVHTHAPVKLRRKMFPIGHLLLVIYACLWKTPVVTSRELLPSVEWRQAEEDCERREGFLLPSDNVNHYIGQLDIPDEPVQIWTSGRQVFTDWNLIQGCYYVDEIKEENKRTSSYDVTSCSLFCKGHLYFLLNNSTCACAIVPKGQKVGINMCSNPCSGNPQEQCGGSDKHYLLYKYFWKSNENPDNLCMSARFINEEGTWKPVPKNCGDKLQGIAHNHEAQNQFQVTSIKGDWQTIRQQFNEEALEFYSDMELTEENLDQMLNKSIEYWIGAFRGTQFLGKKNNLTKTWKCLYLNFTNTTYWQIDQSHCDEKRQYVCLDNELELPQSPADFNEAHPNNSFPEISTHHITEIYHPHKEKALYMYIIIGVVIPAILLIIIICFFRCIKRQKANEKNDTTKTTDISGSCFDDSLHEPNYEEVADEGCRDSIYISNYSEPLPLKDISMNQSKDYADPYDSVKNKPAFRKFIRQPRGKQKNGKSTELCPEKDQEHAYDTLSDDKATSKKHLKQLKQNKLKDNLQKTYEPDKNKTAIANDYQSIYSEANFPSFINGQQSGQNSDTANGSGSHYAEPYDVVHDNLHSIGSTIKTTEVTPYMVVQPIK